MSQSYEPEFKKKIVRLHMEQGRTYKSITAEYGVSKASISRWCGEFSKECLLQAQTNPESQNEMELMKENLRLHKKLEAAKKEALFLKKAAAFFAKEIDERLIGLFKNTMTSLAYVGCSECSKLQQMLTITSLKIGSLIFISKNRTF